MKINRFCIFIAHPTDLVRRLIGSIKVESENKLIIQLQSGVVMEQEMEVK